MALTPAVEDMFRVRACEWCECRGDVSVVCLRVVVVVVARPLLPVQPSPVGSRAAHWVRLNRDSDREDPPAGERGTQKRNTGADVQ